MYRNRPLIVLTIIAVIMTLCALLSFSVVLKQDMLPANKVIGIGVGLLALTLSSLMFFLAGQMHSLGRPQWLCKVVAPGEVFRLRSFIEEKDGGALLTIECGDGSIFLTKLDASEKATNMLIAGFWYKLVDEQLREIVIGRL